MKKNWSTIIGTMCAAVWLAAGAGVSAASLEPGLVARIHFAGSDAVDADPGAGPLKYIWTAPDALTLRAATLDKLNAFMGVWLRQQVAPNLAGSLEVRPLLADLQNAEWQLDFRQPAAGAEEFFLAVRLSKAREQEWTKTLSPVVDAWKTSGPEHHGQFTHNGDWLVLQLGSGPTAAPVPALSPLNKAWLGLDVDWTKLAEWIPAVKPYELPQTHLQVDGRGGKFELTGNLFLSEPLAPLPKWQFPTNTIHSPYDSITAVRGISHWLKQQPWVASLGIGPLPDQLFSWALPQFPFQAYSAFPMSGAAEALPKLQQALEPILHGDAQNRFLGRLTLTMTNNQLALIGMPWMAPYFQPIHESSGDYMLAGCFPNNPRGRPAPADFFMHLNLPGIVLYHWEDTSERFKLFPQLYQLTLAMSGSRQVLTNNPAGHWLEDLKPSLGTSETTVTETSPTELKFVRESKAGLTALELVALASWLDAPNFPGCDLRMPPPKRMPHPPKGAPQPPFTLHH